MTLLNNDYIVSKTNEIREEEKLKAKNAKNKIPEKYHDSLLFLQQSYVIGYGVPEDPDNLPDGVYTYDGRVYIDTREPYLAVAGRNQWFVDAHAYEDGTRAKFYIKDNIDKIIDIIQQNDGVHPKVPIVVEVESELYGSARGEATIFWNGQGANETNPLENASTSALGRALAKLGFGIAGTGIASADEVLEARHFKGTGSNKENAANNQRDQQDKQKQEGQNKTGNGKKSSVLVKVTEIPEQVDENGYWVISAETLLKKENKMISGSVFIQQDLVSESFITNLQEGTQLIVKGQASQNKEKTSFQVIADEIDKKNKDGAA